MPGLKPVDLMFVCMWGDDQSSNLPYAYEQKRCRRMLVICLDFVLNGSFNDQNILLTHRLIPLGRWLICKPLLPAL